MALNGYCPACGVATLVVTSGTIGCSNTSCTNPGLADRILNQPDQHIHLVRIGGPNNHTIRHPIGERIDNELMDCALGPWMETEWDHPPGLYVAKKSFVEGWVLIPE